MTHGSLFSGIGGFDLAAEWMGWTNLFHVERDEFCQRVLAHHFPNSKSYNDVTTFDGLPWRGRIDVLSGGFPCQPYSMAGARKGAEDDRHLWPDMLRVIREVQPTWVVGENVLGLTNWNEGVVFDEIHVDLETEGYEVQSYVLPACGQDAPHIRTRVFIIAHTKRVRLELSEGSGDLRSVQGEDGEGGCQPSNAPQADGTERDATDTNQSGTQGERGRGDQVHRPDATADSRGKGLEGEASGRVSEASRGGDGGADEIADGSLGGHRSAWANFPTFAPLCGGDDGIPRDLVDITFPRWRKESIKALGNAVVPQVIQTIFQSIEDYEEGRKFVEQNN